MIGYLLKKKFRIHLTVQEHGDVFSLPYWRQETFLNQIRYRIGIFVLKRADVVRVVANRIEDTLLGLGVKKESIRKLPVAIDVSAFESVQPNAKVKELFSEDSFIFLTVARFVKQKNFPLLINAFQQAYLKNRKLKLLIVGTGPEETLIKDLIINSFPNTEEGCPIKILPWSDDVAGLMAESDAYVLSSNYEGWARVLIEAAYIGLPIVTTDVGCANEVIKNAEHGYVVPVNNQEKLSEAMLKMSQNQTEYKNFATNLNEFKQSAIPGANLTKYGDEWVSALQ